jgi:thiamine biosynthesis lipoprotein
MSHGDAGVESGGAIGRAGATGADGASGDIAPGARVLVAETARIMAIEVSVQLAAAPAQEAAARNAAHVCMAFFAEVDARLSRFKPESELSRLNRAGRAWVDVSDLLFDCLAEALDAARATGGLFDPTLLHPLEALGYDRDYAAIARREVAADVASGDVADAADVAPRDVSPAHGRWREIELDRARRRVRLPDGVAIDLGGIAKGWAADVAFARFCAGFPGALLNLGGDLRLHGGPQPGQPWSVGIRDPRDEQVDGAPRYSAVIAFSRGGLATSGAVSRWWRRGGQRQHHLLDPRTGQPMRLWVAEDAGDDGESGEPAVPQNDEPASDLRGTRLIATATALAPTATQAEVAAKLALLRGYPDALRAVERAWGAPFAGSLSSPNGHRVSPAAATSPADADVALLLAFGVGEVALSQNLRAYLASWATEGAAVPLRVAGSNVEMPPQAAEG